MSRGSGGVRVARAMRATRSCPRVSTCGSAFRASAICDQSWSCAVDRTFASWILGASAPRCVVDSVRSGPAADPLNKYLPISKNAWELGVGGWALTRFDNLSRRLSGDFVPIRNTRWLSTGVRVARPARECGADDRLPPRRPRSHHAMARLSCHAVRSTRLEWTGL